LSFRRRLTLFFLLIVVLPMIALAVLVIEVSGESRTGKADARLAAGLETARAVYESEQADSQRAVRQAAGDPRLSSALAAGGGGGFSAAAAPVADAAGLQSLALLDSNGEEIARVGSSDSVASAEVRLQGAEGSVRAVLGSVITAEVLAKRVGELTGREVAITAERRPLAASLPLGDVGIPAGGEAETVTSGGEEQRAASTDLPEPGTDQVRLSLFTPLEEAGLAATEPVVIAALAVFLAIAVAFVVLLLRTLHGQVGAIFDAARRIGGGDFSRKVPVQGDDEMAGLAREFNKMSDRLATQIDELRRQRVELDQSVRRIGEAFASGLDRTALLEIVAQTALSACEADAARIDLAGGTDAAVEVGGPGDSAMGEAMRAAESEALRQGALGEASPGDVHALAQPLSRAAGEAGGLGVMAIARAGARRFSDEQREVLRYLVGQVSVSIENIGLHELVAEQAVTDELTGLANQRGFREWMENEAARAERFGHDLSLLMLDVDDFKRVNDAYGHLQGDEVLRTVGRILQRESRGIDEPARYGGEEFAVGLPETDLEGAAEVAERVRMRIEETEVPRIEAGEGLRITASVGVATRRAAAGDVRSLVAAADEALYRAKRGGKNRVERAARGHASLQGFGR
jgi:diguanylate cyclase (GGDEF)-like protein